VRFSQRARVADQRWCWGGSQEKELLGTPYRNTLHPCARLCLVVGSGDGPCQGRYFRRPVGAQRDEIHPMAKVEGRRDPRLALQCSWSECVSSALSRSSSPAESSRSWANDQAQNALHIEHHVLVNASCARDGVCSGVLDLRQARRHLLDFGDMTPDDIAGSGPFSTGSSRQSRLQRESSVFITWHLWSEQPTSISGSCPRRTRVNLSEWPAWRSDPL
jgi:hypothetical protein